MPGKLCPLVASLLLVAHVASAQYLTELPSLTQPAQQPPQPVAATPADSAALQKLKLLQQKIAERDSLQQEIDRLCEATRTAQQIVVNLELLEVNFTACRKQGIELPESNRNGHGNRVIARGVYEKIKQNNLAKVLASPTLATLSGRPVSLNAGGEFPAPVAGPGGNAVEFRKVGTQLDLLAVSLGNNRVRLQVRPRISDVTNENSAEINGVRIPAVNVLECDVSCETAFGETISLIGLSEPRTTTTRGPLGRRTETIDVGLMVVVTPEKATTIDPKLQPASLVAPRPQ